MTGGPRQSSAYLWITPARRDRTGRPRVCAADWTDLGAELIWGCLLSSGQGGAGPLFLAWDRGARLVVRRCLPGCGARVSWTRGQSDMRGSGCRMTILRRGARLVWSRASPRGAAHSWCACAPCALRPVWPRRAGERVWWVRSWFLRTWLSRSGRAGRAGRGGRAGPRRPWLPGTTASRRSRGRWRWRPRRASCRGRSGPGSGRAGGGCRHRPVPRPVRGPAPRRARMALEGR